jgi:hypothetical protein
MSQREWRELNSKRLTSVSLHCKALFCASVVSTLLILSFQSLPLGMPVYAQFDPDEIERVYQSKDYAKVEAIANARLKIDPYDVRARYYLASVLLQQKRGGQALVQYEACVKCGGSSTLAQMARKAILALKIDSKKANPQFFVRAKAVSKSANSSESSASSASPDSSDSSDSDVSPANREAIALLRKDLADAIEVKRRRQSQDLELVGEEENQAILEAASTASIHRDDMIEAVRVEAAAKRAKVYRLYKEEEESITKAYQARINALKNSYKKAQ